MLRAGTYRSIHFVRCEFWYLDLSSAKFVDCHFSRCSFGDMRADGSTRFDGSVFDDGSSVASGSAVFAPDQIEQRLRGMGAKIVSASDHKTAQALVRKTRSTGPLSTALSDT